MPNFEEDLSLKILIENELKNYTDEDMLWLYDEVDLFQKESDLDLRIIRLNFNEFTKEGYVKNHIINLLSEFKNENLLDLFNRFKIRKKKHNEDYSYLKEDQRFCLLAGNYLYNLYTERETYLYTENYYIYVIYNIIYKTNREYKVDILFKEYKIKILLKINKSKNFEDFNFLEWAYTYIRTKNKEFKRVRYIPKNEKDHKNLIISFLDYLFYFDKDQHYVLTTQLFKAWSQRKFRDSEKTKNMYHLPLTKKAKKELKKLSQVKNLSENLVLEKLINDAYLKEICDENGVSRY